MKIHVCFPLTCLYEVFTEEIYVFLFRPLPYYFKIVIILRQRPLSQHLMSLLNHKKELTDNHFG